MLFSNTFSKVVDRAKLYFLRITAQIRHLIVVEGDICSLDDYVYSP